MAHPGLCFGAELTLATFRVTAGSEVGTEVVADVVEDCLAFGDDDLAGQLIARVDVSFGGKYFFVRTSRGDADCRRATKRVKLLQLGACAALFVALEYFDVVFELQFFEEPDDSLGARLLEPDSL